MNVFYKQGKGYDNYMVVATDDSDNSVAVSNIQNQASIDDHDISLKFEIGDTSYALKTKSMSFGKTTLEVTNAVLRNTEEAVDGICK